MRGGGRLGRAYCAWIEGSPGGGRYVIVETALRLLVTGIDSGRRAR
ncbi:hypothetical protein AKJ09_00804 [Labilithrix luteola]|uniref:Uncharacterized protein n=1 Tax=Labilithrix luteola TaxID=1391654 RepID=A0A0K1PKT4_9BACT|nr:hypothetical protein AKJ09_00804 [Labilithrix luteola]